MDDRKVDYPVLNGVAIDISWKNFWDNRQHAIDTRKVAILHAIDELLEVA